MEWSEEKEGRENRKMRKNVERVRGVDTGFMGELSLKLNRNV